MKKTIDIDMTSIKEEPVINQQKKVFMDIDSVLADFGAFFLEYLGIEDRSQATEWGDHRYIDNLHRIENDARFWLNIPPLNNPSDINFRIDGYCTARSIPTEITELWLERNGFPQAPVLTVGTHQSKVKALKLAGCDIFLDDAPHNFEELNMAGIKTYLYTRPHNRRIKTHLRVDTIQEFGIRAKDSILVLGHKEHGKTTLAQMINKASGLLFDDSSMAAAKIFIYDSLKDKYGYQSFEECYTDRRNRRGEWYDLICDYNKDNKTRLAEQILMNNDMYIGMRSQDEIQACKDKGIFDVILGIYDPRKPLEDSNSFNIDLFDSCDFLIHNTKGLEELYGKVNRIFNGAW